MVSIAVLYTTTEPKVVRNYVIALWLADIGHILTTGYVMGYDKFMDFANYNPTTWGNVGATVSTVYPYIHKKDAHLSRLSCVQLVPRTSWVFLGLTECLCQPAKRCNESSRGLFGTQLRTNAVFYFVLLLCQDYLIETCD
jgi:hypothetical protein